MMTARQNPDECVYPASETAEATLMFREAAEAANVVERQLHDTESAVGRIAASLRQRPVTAVVTLARGSSDHATTFARYLVETRLGLLTSSAAPSVSSLYASGAQFRNTVVLAISQSGKSPDLLAAAAAARDAGARVIALVNAVDSPLADLADELIPLHAGRENSVAATKSFIASLAAIVHLVGHWSGSDELLDALRRLPRQLELAWKLDWRCAAMPLKPARNLYVIARGIGLGIAQEAALKFKETSGMHAEALSAAELLHGPMAIVQKGFPILAFSQHDATRPGTRRLIRDLAAQDASVLSAGLRSSGTTYLPAISANPVVEPILQIQSFYRLVNLLAVERGFDPDRPRNLSKVTETL